MPALTSLSLPFIFEVRIRLSTRRFLGVMWLERITDAVSDRASTNRAGTVAIYRQHLKPLRQYKPRYKSRQRRFTHNSRMVLPSRDAPQIEHALPI